MGSGPSIWRSVCATILVALMLATGSAAQQSKRNEIGRLIRGNSLSEAEQQLWVVLRANPNQGWALDLLGSIRLRQNRDGEAKALFQRAFTLNEHDVQALRGLADATRTAGQPEDAAVWYTKLLVIAPTDVPARKALAALQEKAGHYQESVDTISGIPTALRSPELLPILASDYLAMHQDEKLGTLISQVLRLGPSQSAVIRDFVAVLLKNGYLQDADMLLQRVRPVRSNANYLHILARVREAQGRIPEADDLLQQASKLEPKSYDLLFDCARFAAQHEHWNEAVDFLERANVVKPDQPEVLLKLTLALLKTRRREKAVGIAKRLNSISPDDPDSQYILAFALVENELWEMAEPIALKAVQSRPGDANTQLLMGLVHLSKGDMAAARESIERSLALDPHLPDAHYYSALLFERTGNADAARKELDALVRSAPNHAGGQAELGVLKLRAGDVQGAREALETAVKLEPEVSQSHYQLGLVYARMGLQNEAKAEMDQYQKLREAENNWRRHEVGVDTPQ